MYVNVHVGFLSVLHLNCDYCQLFPVRHQRIMNSGQLSYRGWSLLFLVLSVKQSRFMVDYLSKLKADLLSLTNCATHPVDGPMACFVSGLIS